MLIDRKGREEKRREEEEEVCVSPHRGCGEERRGCEIRREEEEEEDARDICWEDHLAAGRVECARDVREAKAVASRVCDDGCEGVSRAEIQEGGEEAKEGCVRQLEESYYGRLLPAGDHCPLGDVVEVRHSEEQRRHYAAKEAGAAEGAEDGDCGGAEDELLRDGRDDVDADPVGCFEYGAERIREDGGDRGGAPQGGPPRDELLDDGPEEEGEDEDSGDEDREDGPRRMEARKDKEGGRDAREVREPVVVEEQEREQGENDRYGTGDGALLEAGFLA